MRALLLLTVIVLAIAFMAAWFNRWNKARITRKIARVQKMKAKPRKSPQERYAAGEINEQEFEELLNQYLRRQH